MIMKMLLVVALGSGLVSFTGCAGGKTIDNLAVNTNPSDNPAEQLNKLEAAINDGYAKNVNVLSPTWFASAEKSLQKAKDQQNRGSDFKELFQTIAQGQAQIQRANEYAKISERSLPDILKAREDARIARQNAKQAGATNLGDLTDDYNDAEKEFQRVAEYIENNDTRRVDSKRNKVIEKYRQVSVKATRKETLGTAKRVVDEAIRLDAKEYLQKL